MKIPLKNIISLSKARSNFSKLIENALDEDIYLITRSGKPAVVIASVDKVNKLGKEGGINVEAELKTEKLEAKKAIPQEEFVERPQPKTPKLEQEVPEEIIPEPKDTPKTADEDLPLQEFDESSMSEKVIPIPTDNQPTTENKMPKMSPEEVNSLENQQQNAGGDPNFVDPLNNPSANSFNNPTTNPPNDPPINPPETKQQNDHVQNHSSGEFLKPEKKKDEDDTINTFSP